MVSVPQRPGTIPLNRLWVTLRGTLGRGKLSTQEKVTYSAPNHAGEGHSSMQEKVTNSPVVKIR